MEKKRGKPVTHPPVLNPKTGKIYRTYTEAAEDCGGSRYGVMRVCYRVQQHHHGIKFRFVERRSK